MERADTAVVWQVYALTKERDMLRRESSRKSDTSTLLKEKDEIIKQVMAEGQPTLQAPEHGMHWPEHCIFECLVS